MAAPSGCALSGARKRLRSTLRLLAAGGWNLAARAELRWKVHPRRGIPAAGRPGRTPPHPSMPRPADRGHRRVQDRRRAVSDRVPSGQIFDAPVICCQRKQNLTLVGHWPHGEVAVCKGRATNTPCQHRSRMRTVLRDDHMTCRPPAIAVSVVTDPLIHRSRRCSASVAWSGMGLRRMR